MLPLLQTFKNLSNPWRGISFKTAVKNKHMDISGSLLVVWILKPGSCFVTGSSVCLVRNINITFSTLPGLAHRPIAHCMLELSFYVVNVPRVSNRFVWWWFCMEDGFHLTTVIGVHDRSSWLGCIRGTFLVEVSACCVCMLTRLKKY